MYIFDAREIRKIVNHDLEHKNANQTIMMQDYPEDYDWSSKRTEEDEATLQKTANKNRRILFVGDHGVYFMSALSKRYEGDVVFAMNCNPNKVLKPRQYKTLQGGLHVNGIDIEFPFSEDEVYDMKVRYFGGDDGAESFDLDEEFQQLANTHRYVVVECTPETLNIAWIGKDS